MKIIQFILCLGLWIELSAQSKSLVDIPTTVRKGIIYKTEWSLDVSLHTNGFFVGYNKAKIKNYHTSTYIHGDLGFIYHPKETRSTKPNNSGFKSFNAYKFGKQNQLINLRIGRGVIKTLSEKARNKGIALGLRLEGGVTLGLLKPNYLKISDEQDGRFTIKDIKYSDNPAEFLNPNHILGASSFFKGIQEISLVPGMFARVAVRLDPGAFEKMVRCLEAGIQLDLYTKRPAILANHSNPLSYINLYLNLQLGKRTN